jgi:hypothetical protein
LLALRLAQQVRQGAGHADVQSVGNPLQGHGRLLAQPPDHLQLLCVAVPTGFPAGLRQSVEEQRSVPVILENGFAPVAAVQDVINRAGIF